MWGEKLKWPWAAFGRQGSCCGKMPEPEPPAEGCSCAELQAATQAVDEKTVNLAELGEHFLQTIDDLRVGTSFFSLTPLPTCGIRMSIGRGSEAGSGLIGFWSGKSGQYPATNEDFTIAGDTSVYDANVGSGVGHNLFSFPLAGSTQYRFRIINRTRNTFAYFCMLVQDGRIQILGKRLA